MESCSNVISILFILQYVITATQNRVYMEVFAGIPALDTNAPAKIIILDTNAMVSSIAIMYTFKFIFIVLHAGENYR